MLKSDTAMKPRVGFAQNQAKSPPSSAGIKVSGPQSKQPRSDVKFKIQLQKVAGKIYAAKNLNEILVSLIEDIAELFESERITIYMLDGENRELVSRFKSGKDVKEIRIGVRATSIAGYAAHKQKLININDVNNPKELKAVDSSLKHDKTWDQQTGFTTKQILAVPIFFQKYLMGALQLMNKKTGQFTPIDERAATELARILGIGLHNQKRTARGATKNKYALLLQRHLVSPKELQKAIEEAGKKNEDVESYLTNNLKVPKSDIVESLGQYYNVPYVQYDEDTPIRKDIIDSNKLKIPFLQKNLWVPLRDEGDKVIIAIDDPQNFQKIGGIKSVFPNNPLEFCVALKEDILEFIRLFTEGKKKDPTQLDLDEISKELQEGMEDDSPEEEEASLVDEKSSAVVKLVNKVIIDSYHQNVSDIHIEPQPGKQDVKVRIRIDGACRWYDTPIPYTHKTAIVSRIKIMSGLDIAERRKPQDGKIQFKKFGNLNIELRVATVPTQGGMEDIVMRILAAGEPIPLEKMGFSDNNLKEFMGIIQQPYGIIFVCGPTGSGKTTTLHSALKVINKVETKIWTAEDPVEITQTGLRQVQMQPKIGLDFASAMRSFLRADPDVIMVGEMRDKETTSIGIEASLTGHLVFSTLHTNSAPESVTRLLDMGMDPFNFADAMLGILAQRLVRTLCKDCKEAYTPSKDEFDELVRHYDAKDFEKNQPKDVNGDPVKFSKELIMYKPKKGGCEKCTGTGYRGRMGIHELMLGTDIQKKLIQTQARVEEMRMQAMEDGMRTLKQDGIEKIFSGHTDLAQVRKVCIQ
ncbi:MAG: GspE/PulE family protein [Desulfobacteraceae bacterium]|nr:GspE/PulE family protein [Desulfobacteraceae bacterium]